MKKLFFTIAFLLTATAAFGWGTPGSRWYYNQGMHPYWKAVSPDAHHVIKLQTVGIGTLTITRTTPQWCYDSVDQFYKQSAANEPCIRGRITGAAGSHVVYNTDASGVELSDWSLQKDSALTNLVIYSHDLSQSTYWPANGTPVITYGVAGLDGAGSATTIEDDSTTVAEYVYQNVTLTAPLPPMVIRYWIKKEASATANAEFTLFFMNSASEYHDITVNLQTGAALVRNNTTGTLAYEVNAKTINGDDWWEVLLSATPSNTANTIVKFHGVPAQFDLDTTTIDVANVGSATYGNVELYQNATISDIRDIGPIFTDAATVSTGAQTIAYDIANHHDEGGAYYFEWTPLYDWDEISGVDQYLLESIGYIDPGVAEIGSWDGTTYIGTFSTFQKGTTYKVGVIYDSKSGQRAINVDGTWETTGAYDGSFNIGTELNILDSSLTNRIKNIKYYRNGTWAQYKAQIDKLME